MPLIDLWNSDRSQVDQKRIEQLIAFAGEGKLLDGNNTSRELRQLLAVVPSDLLGQWIDESLTNRFPDFGLVLQDIVNEIGRRLNFVVTHGVYRGHANEGFDGLWRISGGGGAILVESKSSTSYSISLTRIAEYRRQVDPDLGIPPEEISILIVVGTEETDELEAQVRGSRFAWSIRLLGMKSLFRLLKLKEALDDPGVERQIQEILVPQEFTRLDRIVDLVFATAEDTEVTPEAEIDESLGDDEAAVVQPRASFHAAIIPKLEKHFGQPLVKRSRVLWASPNDEVLLSCQVSKEFKQRGMHFWFGLKRTTEETLSRHENSFCSFGLGSADLVVLMPFKKLAERLPYLNTSPEEDGQVRHWHIKFLRTESGVELVLSAEQGHMDVTEYLLQP